MPERETDRRRERDRVQAAPSPLRRDGHPVLALQRSIGNRAVAQMLARAPATTGTGQIHGVGEIKVQGGNLEEWTGKGAPDPQGLLTRVGAGSGRLP